MLKKTMMKKALATVMAAAFLGTFLGTGFSAAEAAPPPPPHRHHRVGHGPYHHRPGPRHVERHRVRERVWYDKYGRRHLDRIWYDRHGHRHVDHVY